MTYRDHLARVLRPSFPRSVGLATCVVASSLAIAAPASAHTQPLGSVPGPALMTTSVTMPAALVGTPYMSAVAGTRNHAGSWRSVPGTMPAGLNFDSHSGVISGLPLRAGSWVAVLQRTGAQRETMFVRLSALSRAVATTGTATTTATSGAISGTVSSATGAVVHGCVLAVDANGRSKTASTTVSGAYAISGLSPGVWEVEFTGCGENYLSQWWPAQPSQVTAHPINVVAGHVHPGVDAVLSAGGEISGAVTAAGSSTGLGSVCVYAEPTAGGFLVSPSSAVTAPSGAYTVAGLPAGGYLVGFVPCAAGLNRLTQWWTAQGGVTNASVITVKVGAVTTGISAALVAGGAISGTVRAGGKPVANVCVSAQSLAQPSDMWLASSQMYGQTDASGHYVMEGLAPGDYLVGFSQCNGLNAVNYVLPVYWPGSGNISVLPPVVVTAGKVTAGISVALKTGGVVSGTVSSATGKPLAGVCVFVEARQGFFGGTAVTGANGSYSVVGVATGTYIAVFQPCSGQNYASQPWKGGATFAVKAGKTTTGISAVLQAGAEISGAVVSSTGAPLSALCVVISLKTTTFIETQEAGPYGFGGSFSLPGLAAGRYAVGFSGSCMGQNYATTSWDGGKYFNLTAGEHISVALTLAPGGLITGTVTSQAGKPISGVCVTAIQQSPTLIGIGFTFALGGSYQLAGLDSGPYSVQFGPCFGQNLLSVPYAKGTVVVTAGKATTGISAALPPGSVITGRVTDSSGRALTAVCVTAWYSSGGFRLETLFGAYTMQGLPAGTYKVEFSSCAGGSYVTQWWKDASSRAKATPVVLGSGATVSGIDAAMQG